MVSEASGSPAIGIEIDRVAGRLRPCEPPHPWRQRLTSLQPLQKKVLRSQSGSKNSDHHRARGVAVPEPRDRLPQRGVPAGRDAYFPRKADLECWLLLPAMW